MESADKDDRPQTLGEFVRQERERAGLSIRQLATEAGVAASNISRLESNKARYQRPELLKSIADVLDLDLSVLLGYQYGEPVADAASQRLNVYLRQEYGLPDEGIAEAESAIEQIAAKYRKP